MLLIARDIFGTIEKHNQRVELAPKNENQFKFVTFRMFMVQCKSVNNLIWSDLRTLGPKNIRIVCYSFLGVPNFFQARFQASPSN